MSTALNEIRMMPREVPRDEFHERIIDGLVRGEVDPRSLQALFNVPGVGFHRSLYCLTLHLAHYRLSGNQSFVIPAPMQEALARTSLEEVGVEDIRIPYTSQYIALPGCEHEIWGGEDTRWHKVGGVFLRHSHGEEGYKMGADGKSALVIPPSPDQDKGVIHFYLWGMENDASMMPGDDASIWLALDLNEMGKMDVETYLLSVLAKGGRDQTDALRGLYRNEQGEPTVALGGTAPMTLDPMALGPVDAPGLAATWGRGTDHDQKIADSVFTVVRIILNALLYLDSEGADQQVDPECVEATQERSKIQAALDRMKNQRKRKGRHLRKRLAALPVDNVVWIGRSVAFGGTTGSKNASGSPQRRHWVRGHWWPRRDTIRRRIAAAEAQVQAASEAYDEMVQSTEGLSEPEDLAVHLPHLTALRKAHEQAQKSANEQREKLAAKRRWVMPYQKGSRTEAGAVESHTYMLGEETANDAG